MEDVRLYTRDLLQEYSALQRFTPFRSEGAHCFNYKRMLAEFGFPLKSPNYVRSFSPRCTLAMRWWVWCFVIQS